MDFKKIKNKKKAQIIGQAFIFILAAILFSLILLYGYKAISRIGETQSEVELVEFRDSLSTSVNQIRQDYGSVKKYPLNIPNDYKEICFVDLKFLTGVDGINKLNAIRDERPLIADIIESGLDQSVFTKPVAKTPFKIGDLDLGDDGILCVENKGGTINLRLEGLGDKAGITEWPTG